MIPFVVDDRRGLRLLHPEEPPRSQEQGVGNRSHQRDLRREGRRCREV